MSTRQGTQCRLETLAAQYLARRQQTAGMGLQGTAKAVVQRASNHILVRQCTLQDFGDVCCCVPTWRLVLWHCHNEGMAARRKQLGQLQAKETHRHSTVAVSKGRTTCLLNSL